MASLIRMKLRAAKTIPIANEYPADQWPPRLSSFLARLVRAFFSFGLELGRGRQAPNDCSWLGTAVWGLPEVRLLKPGGLNGSTQHFVLEAKMGC